MQLSDKQKKWLIAHFKNTKNDDIILRLSITHSSLHRFARKMGLKKTSQFVHKCQAATTEAARIANKNNNWPPKGYKIPRSEENRFKPGVSYRQKFGTNKDRKRINKIHQSRNKTIALDRIRIKWGLEQKTKLKLIVQPRSKVNYRHNFKKRGYIVDRDAKTIYYNQNTNRSLIAEKRASHKFRFCFIALTLSVCVVQPCTYFQFTTNLLAALHIHCVRHSTLLC